MAFNQQAFMKAQYQPRTADVDVPSLAAYFDDEEKPVWTVKGQTASDVAKAIEAAAKNNNISSIIEAIGKSNVQVDELKKAIGISDDTPQDIVKRLEQLTQCSVSPAIDLSCAVKLAESHPIEFYILTNKIVELTGMGMDLKKPKASGKKTE